MGPNYCGDCRNTAVVFFADSAPLKKMAESGSQSILSHKYARFATFKQLDQIGAVFVFFVFFSVVSLLRVEKRWVCA